ncbi:unnamed protein product [Rotaria sordida]|uniref:Uncharacterized protein n=1 Tax=Rotaria sordida TaxID=392033 RepID=A0A814JRC3_9BILA|nr:unnamed protein product [Rotaria sordida]CAF0957649.1 unnamed protein product [Rotaria sordida]CAF0959483.1 unnamed protein product [Rotaria sordida]CAF1041146.1 unnamed protein product [Rotaria sordida]CAF3733220.1 unnamed protein product [Rotaria sordida]
MSIETFRCFLLVLFLILNGYIQGENSTDVNTTLISVPVAEATTTSPETDESTLLLCPEGHINPPNCTQCPLNYQNKDNKCFEIKSELRPSNSTGRRILLIVFICLLSVFAIFAMVIVYIHLNQKHHHRLTSNQGDNLNLSTNNTNINNRFNNILRSIGWINRNKRGRFNFFSISNNNQSSGQYRQPDTSRADLNENLDEALLFDDPYADGGLHNSSANPYKSLTLAIT